PDHVLQRLDQGRKCRFRTAAHATRGLGETVQQKPPGRIKHRGVIAGAAIVQTEDDPLARNAHLSVSLVRLPSLSACYRQEPHARQMSAADGTPQSAPPVRRSWPPWCFGVGRASVPASAEQQHGVGGEPVLDVVVTAHYVRQCGTACVLAALPAAAALGSPAERDSASRRQHQARLAFRPCRCAIWPSLTSETTAGVNSAAGSPLAMPGRNLSSQPLNPAAGSSWAISSASVSVPVRGSRA